jgi:hypothetical protein
MFSNLHLAGWAFDVELLIVSSFLRCRTLEIPVDWREVDGSKLSTTPLNVVRVAVSMLRDMICVRICYETGLWKIQGAAAAAATSDATATTDAAAAPADGPSLPRRRTKAE